MEIAKERMHRDDYHLIEKHKALLPTFAHENDNETKKLMLEWTWTKSGEKSVDIFRVICCYLVKP